LAHFHGHSELRISNPLRQHLDLTGFALPEDQKAPEDMLTADEIFDISLRRPTHVTIMGCSSARATVSDCDDLFGLTTVLYCAGASAVISALWPIGSGDGILFSEAFYGHLMGEMDNSGGPKIVNMANAMQARVLALRNSGSRNRKPYHWAGLVLSSYWLFRIK
jgi:CHAT domain-containing protein